MNRSSTVLKAVAILLLQACGLPAQTDSLVLRWEREIGAGIALRTSQFTTAAVDCTGGIYAAGITESAVGESDLLLVKYDPLGRKIWEATYDGTAGGHDLARWVFPHPEGGVTVVGECATRVDGMQSDAPAYPGVLAVHFSAEGVRLWARELIIGEEGPGLVVHEAVAGPASEVYVLVDTLVSWPDPRQASILKIGGNGDLHWRRPLPDMARPVPHRSRMFLNSARELCVAATRVETSGTGGSQTVSCLYRFGEDGTLLGVLRQQTTPTTSTRAVSAAASRTTGLTAVCFETDSLRYLRCYGGDGEVRWERLVDIRVGWGWPGYPPAVHCGSDSVTWLVRDDPVLRVERFSSSGTLVSNWSDGSSYWPFSDSWRDPDGGLRTLQMSAIVDEEENDTLVARSFDARGGPMWSVVLPSRHAAGEWAHGAVDAAGNQYLLAVSGSLRAADALIVRVDAGGEVQWMNRHTAAGTADASVVDMARGSGGDLYVTGTAVNTKGFFDIFLARMSPLGDPGWVTVTPSSEGRHAIPVKVLTSAGGDVYVAGYLPVTGSRQGGGYLLLRYDSAGVLRREWRYPRSAAPDQPFEVRDAALDGQGEIWLAGSAGVLRVDSAGVCVLQDPRNSWAVTSDAGGRVFIAVEDSVLALGQGGAGLWGQLGWPPPGGMVSDGAGGVVAGAMRIDAAGSVMWQHGGGWSWGGRALKPFLDRDRNVLVVYPFDGVVSAFSIDGDSLFRHELFDSWELGVTLLTAAMGPDDMMYMGGEGERSIVGLPREHLLLRGIASDATRIARGSYSGAAGAYTPQAMCTGQNGELFVVSDAHLSGFVRRPVLQRYDRLVTGVPEAEGEGVPGSFLLEQNYPNPFNPSTTVRYSVPPNRGQAVTVRIYDLLGREIAALADGPHSAGVYTVRWHASAAASGVYFCRMTAGEFTSTVKMLVLK